MRQEGIYMIRNRINNKVYIGQSIDLVRREGDHFSDLRRGIHTNTHLQSSFNKYGEVNFEFIVLEYCDETKLDELEIYYINQYKSYDSEYGYNKTFGGQGGLMRHTDETRRKISENSASRRPEVRQKLRKASMGHVVTEDMRRRIGEGHKGMKHTEETKQILREKNLGKILSEETKSKISKSLTNGKTSKSVTQFNLDGSLVKVWVSASEAGRNGFSCTKIIACCRGRNKTHKGYIWKYTNNC